MNVNSHGYWCFEGESYPDDAGGLAPCKVHVIPSV